MPALYSLDLRERVIGAVEAGVSRRRAASVFKVSVSTVIRWAKRVAETGSYAPLPSGGDHKSKDVEAHKDVSIRREAHPTTDGREACQSAMLPMSHSDRRAVA